MNIKTQRLVESAILIAIGTILSLFSFSGPWIKGGSITICSMLPLVIISFRYGIEWGTFSSIVYAILQAILGASNISYAPNFGLMLGILFLDYIFPFGIIGLAGFFKDTFKSKLFSINLGIVVTFLFRLLFHFLSGWLIWQALWPEAGWIAWVYSIAYNSSYMIPEIIITCFVVTITYKPLEKYWEEITIE